MVALFTDRVERDLFREVKAVVIVGSLATGSYIPGPGSDIDQVTILHDDAPTDTTGRVEDILKDIEQGSASGIPFARSIYHISDLLRPFNRDFPLTRENKKYLEVPVELLRIHESGKLVWGDSTVLASLPVPTREEVREFDELSRQFNRLLRKERSGNSPAKRMRGLPARISGQVLLTNAFRHYYYATGESCSNKLRIYERMRARVPGYLYLAGLELATRMKRSMADNAQALTNTELNALLAEAESLIEWQEQHAVHEVPLTE